MLFAQTVEYEASGGTAAAILIVYGVVTLALLAVHIYVLMDILKYSDADWQRTGQNKTVWVVLWVVGLCCYGPIFDLVWWFGFRPKMQGKS